MYLFPSDNLALVVRCKIIKVDSSSFGILGL